ncbi:MAG: hypothetical protein C5B52_12745 [Bacteroidetes bacterium]|nr:MAG: hypothetical protein C5B52_12745 [Bacteroidota bacterium]
MVKNFTFILLIGLTLSVSGYGQDRAIASNQSIVKLIKFYPNPATTIINFEFQKGYDKSLSFEIFNFLGKKVLELKNVTPINQVNLTDFTRGVYIFQLRDNSGKVLESGKFQVSK